MTNIVMSQKELNRISVLEKLKHKQVTQRKASTLLSLSVRQTRRLLKKYLLHGPCCLVHGNRGKASNRRIDPVVIDRAMKLVGSDYVDFGPTLAHEKLVELHGFQLGVDTVRVNMIKHNLWQPRKRRILVVHQLRQRRQMEGELIQIDGSPHNWFESRIDPLTGKEVGRCTLLVFIDDATGKLMWLEFALSESINSYFKSFKGYLCKHGKPACLYTDKHGVFRVNTSNGGSSDVFDPKSLTQFGRAMEKLGIKIVFAHSPQAKGRVERVNLTLQDRLVKELRLRRINSINQANQYLPEFIQAFNSKFAVEPANPHNAHTPLSETENLDLILSQHHLRTLSKNLSFQYKNLIYQIKTSRQSYTLRRAKVEVIEDPQAKVTITYNNQRLDYTTQALPPRPKIVDSKHLNQELDQVKESKPKTVWEAIAEIPYQNYNY